MFDLIFKAIAFAQANNNFLISYTCIIIKAKFNRMIELTIAIVVSIRGFIFQRV